MNKEKGLGVPAIGIAVGLRLRAAGRYVRYKSSPEDRLRALRSHR